MNNVARYSCALINYWTANICTIYKSNLQHHYLPSLLSSVNLISNIDGENLHNFFAISQPDIYNRPIYFNLQKNWKF